MFKIELPLDSSWQFKVFDEPLPIGKYILTDDHNKVVAQLKVISKEEIRLIKKSYSANQKGWKEDIAQLKSELKKYQKLFVAEQRSVNELSFEYQKLVTPIKQFISVVDDYFNPTDKLGDDLLKNFAIMGKKAKKIRKALLKWKKFWSK